MGKNAITSNDTGSLFSNTLRSEQSNTKGDVSGVKKTTKGKPQSSKKITPTPMNPIQPIYYLPVSQLRAQVFLAHGLIYPAIYDTNNAQAIKDAQAYVPNGLELWKEQPPINKEELLLGVCLTSAELSTAVHQEDTIFLATPIPISRLVELAVPAKSSDDINKYIRGWIEPDVPIPASLFTSAKHITETSTSSPLPITSSIVLPAKDKDSVQHAIARYDRIMGMFAYMRNAARYHSGRLGLYADYPAQFFNLAGQLHTSLDLSQVPNVPTSPLLQSLLEELTSTNPIIDALRKFVTSPGVYIDKAMAKSLALAIQEASGKDVNIQEAFKLLFEEDYKASIRILQKEPISEQSVLLATLFKFSDRQSNDHRNIKPTLHEDWFSVPPVASILGMLGAYYGYTSLDARESRLYSIDRRLSEHIEQRPTIKFHLESRFERELVEAIFQWSFNNKKLDSSMTATFDNLHPKPVLRPESLAPHIWKDDSYKVSDIWVRNFKLTQLARCLQRIEELPYTTIDETTPLGQFLMHLCFFHAEEYELSRKQGQEVIHYRISKQRLIALLSVEKVRVSLKVLVAAIEEEVAWRK
jgi:hypothetical protein